MYYYWVWFTKWDASDICSNFNFWWRHVCYTCSYL